MFCNAATSVLMLTARANVYNVNNGKSANIRILFDNCSPRSYITNNLKEAIDVKKLGTHQLDVSRFMDAENEYPALTQDCDVVEIRVNGVGDKYTLVTACSVP